MRMRVDEALRHPWLQARRPMPTMRCAPSLMRLAPALGGTPSRPPPQRVEDDELRGLLEQQLPGSLSIRSRRDTTAEARMEWGSSRGADRLRSATNEVLRASRATAAFTNGRTMVAAAPPAAEAAALDVPAVLEASHDPAVFDPRLI